MHRFLLILLLSFPIFGEEINDPFEDLNRDIFIFNEKLDEKLLKPAALTYRKVTPQFARTGVTNFFNNLEEIDTTINQVLQGEIKYAFNDASRFVINSTIGLFGLIDVASKMGLERHEEDFGQTLATYNFKAGPYTKASYDSAALIMLAMQAANSTNSNYFKSIWLSRSLKV